MYSNFVFAMQDGVIMAIYAILWLITAIIVTTFAAEKGTKTLAAASVSIIIAT